MKLLFLIQPDFYKYLLESWLGFLRFVVGNYKRSRVLPGHLRKLWWRKDLVIQSSARTFIHPTARLGKSVIFGFPEGLQEEDSARIEIGEDAFIGERVELGVTPGAVLKVGANTSMHTGTVILGNIVIGKNCIFSYNIYMGAGTHVIDKEPTWLIKDQDEYFGSELPKESITIDDDVWLGWGVFVKSGVSIGRGVVVGANSVVVSDLDPYCVYAGVPAKKIKKRLEFTPKSFVSAQDDDFLPYFYEGFEDSRVALTQSRKHGIIWCEANPKILLAPGRYSALSLKAYSAGSSSGNIRILINGFEIANFAPSEGHFQRTFEFDFNSIPASKTGAPSFLSTLLQVEFVMKNFNKREFGIQELQMKVIA